MTPAASTGMEIFSFHLARVVPVTTLGLFVRGGIPRTSGLLHAECLGAMELGAPLFSPSRFQLGNLAVFAQWENEAALDSFLSGSAVGRKLSQGWHVRLRLLRKWGSFPEFRESAAEQGIRGASSPVVAVTIARLRIPEVLRFFRWGRPVEQLVRDHPGKTLAMAAFRFPRTFSTFSIWHSEQQMTDMVRGGAATPGASRHAAAMAERNRRDFHHQFATYRFRPLAEHGDWDGRRGFVPSFP